MNFEITTNPNTTWFTINPVTGTMSGIPADKDVGQEFSVTMRISNSFKEEYCDSFTFTVNGSLSYWLTFTSKLVGYFGALSAVWYVRDELYNLVFCRKNYKYPDIEVKTNEEYLKVI